MTTNTTGHQRLHNLAHKFNWMCVYCNAPLTCSIPNCPTLPHSFGPSPLTRIATRDHVIPKSKLPRAERLRSTFPNSVIACQPCNARKADTHPADFLTHDPQKLELIAQLLEITTQALLDPKTYQPPPAPITLSDKSQKAIKRARERSKVHAFSHHHPDCWAITYLALNPSTSRSSLPCNCGFANFAPGHP